jgi:hypothetical protein
MDMTSSSKKKILYTSVDFASVAGADLIAKSELFAGDGVVDRDLAIDGEVEELAKTAVGSGNSRRYRKLRERELSPDKEIKNGKN